MSMNNKATIIFVLAAWLSAASLVATGDACAGVRSMAMDDACHAATTGPVLFDICMRMLLPTVPPYSEVTNYAIGGAGAAAQSCGSIMDAIEDVLRHGSVNGDLRDAVSRCMDTYRTARRAIQGVKNQLSRCEFGGFEQGYTDAIAAIGACNAEHGPISGTILYGMDVGDRDMTMIALRLGKLLKA